MQMNNKNIVLIGMPGSGKTTFSKKIQNHFLSKYEIKDTDVLIEEKENKTINEIFEEFGESYFRKLESELVESVSKENMKIISTGGGVILNPQNMKFLQNNGIIIFIDRPLHKIIEDFKGDNRPLVRNKIEKLETLYKERIELYKKYSDYIINNENTIEDFLLELEKILKKENIEL